jgi:hypothetical protein
LRIGVLNNLRAGRSDSRVAHVLRVLDRHPEVYHLETQSGAAVPGALELMAKEKVELLVVNGGDGTLQRVLTEILTPKERTWLPLLAPIRGGRTNMTALDLGAKRRPERGLAGLLRASSAGRIEERIVERPVLRVSIDATTGPHFGMFLGVGMLYRAIQLTHRMFPPGRAQGVLGAGIVTGGLLARVVMGRQHEGVLVPDRIQFRCDDDAPFTKECLLVMATTLDRLFLGMRPFWGREPAPMRFTAIGGQAANLRRNAWGILRGRPGPGITHEGGATSRNLRTLEITLDCGAMLDGEMFDPTPGRVIHVSAHDHLRFVRA